MEEIMKCPITLKLGDLGESRSSLIRTKALCTTIGSETTNVNRGTPAFMAPELLVEESKLHSASMDQLKQANIWSMMMTFFLTINPDQSVPYDNENVDSREDIIRLFKEQKQPTPNEMYRKTQSTQYQMLMYLIKRHLDFKPSCRDTAKEIHDFIVKEFTGEFLLTPLEISQSSALIMNDESYAEKLSANENNINHSMLPPLNDGTNGCAFLALGILDKLADLSITEDFIPSTIESVIRNFPLKFNQYRDVNKLYDPFEALEILGRNALLSNELKFVEDILEKHLIFTPESSNHLVSELMDMQIAAKESKSRQFGIFCGGVIIMCLSCSSTGVFTAMDTHPVSEKDKGNGNGLIVMTSSPFKLIEWLLRRADAGPDSERRPFIMKVKMRPLSERTDLTLITSLSSDEDDLDYPSFVDSELVAEFSSPAMDDTEDELSQFSDDDDINKSNVDAGNYTFSSQVMTQTRWQDVRAETVERAPYDIDGHKHYIIKATERKILLDRVKDGRK